jgi:hypothetical protein
MFTGFSSDQIGDIIGAASVTKGSIGDKTSWGKAERRNAMTAERGKPENEVSTSLCHARIWLMELKEQALAPTFARKLGDIPHVSGLLRHIACVSGAGSRVGEWLLKTAIERGAHHYQRDFDPQLPPDSPGISDEQIGVALCLGERPYDLDALRVAAQLLSSPRVNPARLCRLAIQERCEPVLLHIARLAQRFVPELEPWAWLRNHLPPRSVPHSEALPHWSRLVSYTGVTARGGPPETQWLRRHE